VLRLADGRRGMLGPGGCCDAEIRHRLEEVGAWLRVNGEGIYATRPHEIFMEGNTVRHTQSKDGRYVHAIILDWPDTVAGVRLQSIKARPGSKITMLGLDHTFAYTQDEKSLTIQIPDWFGNSTRRPCKYAYVLKIEQAK